MNARIIRIYRIARSDVATGTVVSHADHGIVVDCGVIVGKSAMAGCAVVRADARSTLLARRQADQSASCPVALAAGIMNLIIITADGDAGRTARSPGMTIRTIRGQRRSKGVIGSAVFNGKDAMTGIALSAKAFACCNRHQSTGRAVAGDTCSMLHGRAHRHPAHRPLRAGMTP